MTAAAWSRVRDLDGRPCWPLGVSAGVATLRATRSLASACRMARFNARCPIVTTAVEYPAAIAVSVGRGQVAEFPGADDGQDRLEDVLVLRDRFGGAAVEPGGEPVRGGLPDGVVGVAGLGGDALVELEVQVAELVHDGGLGRAADLAAGAFPLVAGVPDGDLAAPQARAVPVAFGVAAGSAVLEEDAVFAAPAPGGHGDSQPVVGTFGGDDGQPRPGIPRLFRTSNRR